MPNLIISKLREIVIKNIRLINILLILIKLKKIKEDLLIMIYNATELKKMQR